MAQSSIIRFTLHGGTFWNANFFKTLTINETSFLQWEETIDIERIAKQILMLLDWKNCPIECIVLFHSKVDKFMQLILSLHHLLRNIKQDVI
jgi:hypothetical protein